MEFFFIRFLFVVLLFSGFGVGLAQGDDISYIGWTALIVVILVFLVFVGILCMNPELIWACCYCFKDLIKKCCPNLLPSSCSQQTNGNHMDTSLPIDDEPPPPYDEVVDSRVKKLNRPPCTCPPRNYLIPPPPEFDSRHYQKEIKEGSADMMSDEIETFLIRFGIGLASLVGLAYLLCLLNRYLCAQQSKMQRCTCNDHFLPQSRNDAMSIPETLPTQGTIYSITSVSHSAEIDMAGSGWEHFLPLL
uniref:Uncharacterized protein n=1 Tax=Strigamia maritima TaxID=126957 RepID=T1IQ03_STRMM